MSMVCGLDLHRQQITFDALDTRSGEVWRGRVWQPDRARVRRWLRSDVARRADGQSVAMAVEGCTGWRYVAEEITAAGFEAHLAEPADTQAAWGKKHRAKTDRSDARLLRQLLQRGELPESWIPPTIVLEWRERVRLYKWLVDQRLVWVQRIHAELFHHGVAVPEGAIRSPSTRALLAGDEVTLTPAAGQRIRVGYAMIRRRRRRVAAAEGLADPVRDAPAGVSGPGRRRLRDRRADGGGGVVRARRLSSLLALGPGGPSHRVGRQRGRLRLASRLGLPVPAGTPVLRWALVKRRSTPRISAAPTTPYTPG